MDTDVLVAKAGEAFKARNYKTTLDLMSHCLASAPDDGQMFELFYTMASQRPTNIISREFGTAGPLASANAALAAGKLVAALQTCHKAIWANPKSTSALRLYAKIAGESDDLEIAVLALQKAAKLKPTNISILRELGHACWKAKMYGAAQKSFLEIQRIKPADPEASRALHDLAAESTIDEGKYDEDGDFRKSAKDLDSQKRLHGEARIVRDDEDADRAIADLEADIEEDPDSVASHLRLAQLHQKRSDWDKAFKEIDRCLELSPNNAKVLMTRSEFEIARRREALDAVRKRIREHPDDEQIQSEVAELEKAELAFETEELEKQVASLPTQSDLKLRLGRLYSRADRTNDAIAQFQKCVGDPRRRLVALVSLGREFLKKNRNDLAARQFQTVINEVEVMNDIKKESTYLMGRVLQEQGKLREALDSFQTIYEVDISYEDVADRVDALYDELGDKNSET